MKISFKQALAIFTCLIFAFSVKSQTPIRLLPANPHYFEYNGKPLALITSAEHYGALINLDFDYKKYLQTLHDEGMNYTRIFTGSYFEIPSASFSIKHNSLAPQAGSLLTPWNTQEENGRIKYNWNSYNPEYFARLNDFMSLAQSLDIIVEVTPFSSIYSDEHWEINPQNPKNRVGGTDDLNRQLAHTLQNGELTELQKSYVRKLVDELNGFDNFFFEIQNEPWADRSRSVINLINKYDVSGEDWMNKVDVADQASLEWQEEMIKTIVEAEKLLPKKHLIAQNYNNFYAPILSVSEHVSILNFHYNWPESAEMNYHWNKVIGFDESGFAGSEDLVYRRQAWAFMLSGGGLFNNLDYSFFSGQEGGTLENEAPGGGSKALRSQLKILSEFMHELDLANTVPDKSLVQAAPGLLTFALKNGNKGFAVYVIEAGTNDSFFTLTIPAGTYELEELDPISGKRNSLGSFEVTKYPLKIVVKLRQGEMAYRIVKK
ncbi:hypothetical protein GCM10009119_42680 [Algoriphagus jejuensis]|uniref:Cellulase (Glycosyl hydrolase family 5) n=1 Tax=Algoriphagus jejuensis TaxID=419934 RepID=A0ABP3YIM3_9BACT